MKIPQVWDLGYFGDQVVIAGADTGIQWNHPALINKYRGYDKQTGNVDHNYNWWDSIHNAKSSNYCGSNSTQPCDDQGHGTHTMGSSLGQEENAENSNKIGVSPNSRFIGCRNMDAGKGSPSTYIECLQFFLAPTDLNGENLSPELRPHVIINSYDCPASEGCSDSSILRTSVVNLVSAGVFLSVSSGNTGPSCNSIINPPAIYPESFTVGASDYNSNFIASYSSRGPVNDVNVTKPEIIAPGSRITSCFPINNYVTLSGTSMSAPQIAGIVALIYSANPSLLRDIHSIRSILTESAFAIPNSGCSSSENVPNNIYGYGIVSAYDGVLLALNRTTVEESSSVSSTPIISPVSNVTILSSVSNTPIPSVLSTSPTNLLSSSSTVIPTPTPTQNPSSLFPYYSLSDSTEDTSSKNSSLVFSSRTSSENSSNSSLLLFNVLLILSILFINL